MIALFWSPVDPRVSKFAVINESHKRISRSLPFYFVCSNGAEEIINSSYGKHSRVLSSDNNMGGKGKILFEHLREEKFDVLIRVDMDAIVFDLPWLLGMAEEAVGKDVIMGNVAKPRTWPLDQYVRGGCHIVSSGVIRRIRMERSRKGKGFDKPFNLAIKDISTIVPRRVFQVSRTYSGGAPVWHPRKSNKLAWFQKNMRDYVDRMRRQ